MVSGCGFLSVIGLGGWEKVESLRDERQTETERKRGTKGSDWKAILTPL